MFKHPPSAKTHWRLFFVFIFFALGALVITGRYFYLQILHYRDFAGLASKQGATGVPEPRRGAIYFQDKDGKLQAAAFNRDFLTLSAHPKDVSDPAEAASQLAEILHLPALGIEKKLSQQNDIYEVLARKVDDAAAVKIQALDLAGILLENQSRRFYPSRELGAHVLGYAQFDNDTEVGRYGIERQFQNELAGKVGILEGIDTPLGILTLGKRIVYPEENGKDIVLTIDPNIEAEAQKQLEAVVKKYNAESGTVTVVDPMTGKILAMAGVPTFDPNNYGSTTNLGVFLNHVVESNYELGSVMKPVTMASAVNEGVVTPETTYTDTGEVQIKGYRIQNYDGKAHGLQTMAGVLQKSLNTGAVFAEGKIGNAKFLNYLKLFGFGERTGIDLPGEVAGNISNLSAGRDIEFATASFGQGIAVTPMQMTMAVSAIANGGNLMKPYVVDRVVDEAGVVSQFQPEVRRRVISPQTSETLSKMLVSVVETGFENRATIKGYFVAAKTGTAQIPNPRGKGYSPDDFIHSFVGYAPAFNPRFLIFIQMNKPRGVSFASNSLTTTFHDLSSYIINYYGILPDQR